MAENVLKFLTMVSCGSEKMDYTFKKLFFLSLNIFELFNKNKIITRNLQESDLLCSLRYTLQNQIFVSNLKHILGVRIWKEETFTGYQ